MEKIKTFLENYGLSEKEIAVYIGCLRQGDGTVLQIAKQAKVKRPTTYLILEELVKRGLILSKKDRKSIHYFPAHPKKILTDLKNTLEEAEETLPEILSMYRDNSEKPSVTIYDDMEGYTYTGKIVRDAIHQGDEVLVLGNVSFFLQDPESAGPWFKMAKNKKHKVSVLMYGWGDVEKNFVQNARALKNPNLQLRVVESSQFPVHTEQAITSDTTIFFTGGKKFASVVVRSKNMADSSRAIFNQLWGSGVEPETLM